MTTAAEDAKYMALAINLARRGRFTSRENPNVGCVIVNNGAVIGEGYHLRPGEPHAEVHALAAAGDQAQDGTIYVTLEPCSHHGKTPPCADAVIAAKPQRVVIGMKDPNPLVSGRGIKRLEAAGITVECGVLELEAEALNRGFSSRMRHKRPFVTAKIAMSLDGRTAMQDGQSQWITGPEARAEVQRMRALSCAIISGVEAVNYDDSALTIRAADLDLSAQGIDPTQVNADTIKQPLRVVVDRAAKLSPQAKILCQPGSVLLVHGKGADQLQLQQLAEAGATLLMLPETAEQHIDLRALLSHLASIGCNDIMVETGAKLLGGFIAQGLVDRLHVFIAPTLMGSRARPMAELPLTAMAEKQDLIIESISTIGSDQLIQARFKTPSGE